MDKASPLNPLGPVVRHDAKSSQNGLASFSLEMAVVEPARVDRFVVFGDRLWDQYFLSVCP